MTTRARAARRPVSRLPSEQRVADIMAAARAVFVTKGYDDALITDIAERAGVVEGSIYRFFSGKRDLLVRVIEHWYEEMLAEHEAQIAGVEGTRNRIRFIVHSHLRSIEREPALSRLFLQMLRSDPDYRATRLFELNQRYTRPIVDVVRAAIADGTFGPDSSPTLVRDMIYGCIEHHSWAFIRGEGDLDVEETANRITDLVCRGLHPDPGPDRSTDLVTRLEQLVARFEGQG